MSFDSRIQAEPGYALPDMLCLQPAAPRVFPGKAWEQEDLRYKNQANQHEKNSLRIATFHQPT